MQSSGIGLNLLPFYEFQAVSPEVKDFEFEDEEDEIDDRIEEAVTAFNTSSPAQQTYTPSIPSHQTPEPTSDSSHQRTHSNPDPPTTSTSAAVRTVITADREELARALVPQGVEEDDDSKWDSEVCKLTLFHTRTLNSLPHNPDL